MDVGGVVGLLDSDSLLAGCLVIAKEARREFLLEFFFGPAQVEKPGLLGV